MVIAMNYHWKIKHGFAPYIATADLHPNASVTVTIRDDSFDIALRLPDGTVSYPDAGFTRLSEAGNAALQTVDTMVAEHGLVPVERGRVLSRPKYCEACGDPWAPGGSCGACSRAYHDLAASLGADRLCEMRDHSAAHVNDWAVLCRHDVRVGKAESAGRYAVVAARHARRVMRYENALSLCAQEVLQ
jgi:hypothetical protein